MNESELRVRRLRYRLNRQGMLELDAWLARLLQADFNDADTVGAIESLLECEPPHLQAMMQGDVRVPEALAGWLACR
ncbi:succinate dehydrogenase assembly factor 2 [Mariprofundus erugo]|uniref:FAD assembly factor SdhE n=1 Tax=Mariprofundus erugo TaxID=2528639 RepID=A0A5R9GRV7_9PROT|nr:succinate dehydrogenase assembly factor 2 [Mariprofundus erugo]TLS65974.1 succinate dehydrogenase assembly factor 2 [Mariprofundus erugo]TLS76369.1 succinate dehydrogenase assembly factor 2 [Mariprofundus erugo]